MSLSTTFSRVATVAPRIGTALISFAVLNLIPNPVFCAAESKDNSDDIFEIMAKKGKQAMNSFTPDSSFDVDPKGWIENISKGSHDFITKGGAGQVGFGFMMGFSSGYFLKKSGKLVSFVVGGLFCIAQTLSYNGYLQLNFDRLQKDVEGYLDLNKDGKVDAEDAGIGFQMVSKVLKYNLPAGSGFSVGLVAGLKS